MSPSGHQAGARVRVSGAAVSPGPRSTRKAQHVRRAHLPHLPVDFVMPRSFVHHSPPHRNVHPPTAAQGVRITLRSGRSCPHCVAGHVGGDGDIMPHSAPPPNHFRPFPPFFASRTAHRPPTTAEPTQWRPTSAWTLADADALHFPQDPHALLQTGRLAVRQVVWSRRRDDDHGPEPMRVRNIFICSWVVFWAFVQDDEASLRVRPRI